MKNRFHVRALPFALLALLVLLLGSGVARVLAEGIAQVLYSKSLPPATVALIDPESGTSSGGGTTDVKVAKGDVLIFRFNYAPVPYQRNRGLQGYLTEYLPANTQVVGARLIDQNGLTIAPKLPGIARDQCEANCGGFAALPCDPALTTICSAGGTRSLLDGSIAQVYADTGLFFATDARLARQPNNQFLTLTNGTLMSPAPTYVVNIDTLIGLQNQAPVYAHNFWDYIQMRAYGEKNTAVSGNSGKNQTPFGYGSPVAGPQTFYGYEASATQAAPTQIRFNDVLGPWNRIQHIGSKIGSGAPVSSTSGPLTRLAIDVPVAKQGWDLTPNNPLPSSATALRYALGEVRVGEVSYAEIALKVLDTPLDPVQGADVNCGEVFGGDVSASSTGRANNNSWPFYVGSPNCVFLNLLFDLSVDKTLANGGDQLTYTVHGKNLSTKPQANAVAKTKYDSSLFAFVSADGGATQVSNCDGDGKMCVVWPTMQLAPSDEYTFHMVLQVQGTGLGANVVLGNYTGTPPSPAAPVSFTTQALTVVKPVTVVSSTLAATSTPTAPGSTVAFTGTVADIGTADASMGTITLVLPSGWTIATAPKVNGTTLACVGTCTATNTPTYNIAQVVAAGTSAPLSFSATVPAGASVGIYPISLQMWATQVGLGGDFENYFDAITQVAVGQPRSAPPVLDCPVGDTQTSITGTTTAPLDAVVRLYFNGIARAQGTTSSSAWSVGGYASSFGALYGGLEVRATVQGAGQQESPLSAPCFVSVVPDCADGIDNDNDGLIDFPADPGCSSPSDGSEVNAVFQCSDGIDNDGQNGIDYPNDPSCSSPTDPTENGIPDCSDGVDDDGDGLIDAADPGCTSANDSSEIDYAVCQNGLDDDADNLVDFPADPGCDSAIDPSETSAGFSSTDLSPRLLLLFDTSGSMNWNTCNNTFTGGDGSVECPGSDVTTSVCPSSSSSMNGLPDDSRIAKVKRGITKVIGAFGEAQYALMRFAQRPVPFVCPGLNASLASGGWQGAGAAPCGGGFNAGELLVGFAPENVPHLLQYMDGKSNYPGTPPPGMDSELRATGTTPIAGSLSTARTYLQGVRSNDLGAGSCRPYGVILITDGAESCGGDPVAAAAALYQQGFPVHVIGFATPDPTIISNLDSMAAAGGTSSAVFVEDETALSLAIGSIIAGSIKTELCNGVDDDCDMQIDEGFHVGTACDNGKLGTCFATGTVQCASLSSSACNAPNRTGSMEVCDGLDNDCNGLVDDGLSCTICVPATELCNGLDDDCDGLIDENTMADPLPGVGTSCGFNLGSCTAGAFQCVMGKLVCSGQGPQPEVCNNLDDDCDGFVDGEITACYPAGASGCTLGGGCLGRCRTGLSTCNAGVSGPCTDAVVPATELCNGIDDNCDGQIDEPWPTLHSACDNGQTNGCLLTGTIECSSDGSGVHCTAQPVTAGTEVCNGLDDDCDGQIDENTSSDPLPAPIGNPCGGGNGCSPGTLTCVAGKIVCSGVVGVTEICDGIDNDCDGFIDEDVTQGVGDPCTDPGFSAVGDRGACSFGKTACVAGAIVCKGYVGPQTEVCNGLDDNCDGKTDEAAKCSNPGGICRSGECLRPCPKSEFGCGYGHYCSTLPEGDFCVPDPCVSVQCAADQACNQQTGKCASACDTVTCTSGQVCMHGVCTDCFQVPCEGGKLCVANATGIGVCEANPCSGSACKSSQACVDGHCVDTLCSPSCSSEQQCVQGKCETDRCHGLVCRSGQTCDPSTGACAADKCTNVHCTTGQVCIQESGACAPDPCVTTVCPSGSQCQLTFDGSPTCLARAISSSADAGTAAGTHPPRAVAATGGGGYACAVSRPGERTTPGGWPLFGLLGLLWVGRRKRRAGSRNA